MENYALQINRAQDQMESRYGNLMERLEELMSRQNEHQDTMNQSAIA